MLWRERCRRYERACQLARSFSAGPRSPPGEFPRFFSSRNENKHGVAKVLTILRLISKEHCWMVVCLNVLSFLHDPSGYHCSLSDPLSWDSRVLCFCQAIPDDTALFDAEQRVEMKNVLLSFSLIETSPSNLMNGILIPDSIALVFLLNFLPTRVR